MFVLSAVDFLRSSICSKMPKTSMLYPSMALSTFHFSMAFEYPAIPPTDNTAIIAKTPSISIILRPSWFVPLPPVILGRDAQSVPRILSHQGRGNPKPSPRAGEGDALVSGEGYLKNVQKELTLHLQYQPKTSYLSPHPTGCGRRVSMTLLPAATHIDIALAMALWILRPGTSSREYRRRMTLKVEAEKRGNVPPVILLLTVLLPKMSFFLPNPAKTC